jgi:hypothetical protein
MLPAGYLNEEGSTVKRFLGVVAQEQISKHKIVAVQKTVYFFMKTPVGILKSPRTGERVDEQFQ